MESGQILSHVGKFYQSQMCKLVQLEVDLTLVQKTIKTLYVRASIPKTLYIFVVLQIEPKSLVEFISFPIKLLIREGGRGDRAPKVKTTTKDLSQSLPFYIFSSSLVPREQLQCWRGNDGPQKFIIT